MIFWNVKKLSNQLKSNKLSEREKISYVIADTVIVSLVVAVATIFPISQGPIDKTIDVLMSFFEILLAFYFLPKVARINKEGDDKNLIERVICLSLPLSLRVLVQFFLGYLLVTALFFGNFLENETIDNVAANFIYFIALVSFYRGLIFWISEISQNSENH